MIDREKPFKMYYHQLQLAIAVAMSIGFSFGLIIGIIIYKI